MALGVDSLGTEQGYVSIDVTDAKQSMEQLASTVQQTAQSSSERIRAMGESLAGIGTKMSVGITAPIAALGGTALGSFAKLR